MRSHHRLGRLCALAAWLAAAHVHAQDVSLQPQADDGTEHPRGVYTGVKPGGEEPPAIPGASPGSEPAITWPGFQMQPDGSSRVFVQMTARVGVTTALTENRVVVDFGNVPIVGATNRLPLYTKFFDTPVTRIELKRENKRTRMVLTLRTTVQPRVSTEQAKSGYWFVYVDFPEGDYLSGEAPKVEPPPEPGPPAPAPAEPATQRAPSHLEGDVEASASGSASAEVQGTGKVKAGGKAKAKAKLKVGL